MLIFAKKKRKEKKHACGRSSIELDRVVVAVGGAVDEGRHVVEVFGDGDVAEIVPEPVAPHGQPADVVDGQIVRQTQSDRLARVRPQHVVTVSVSTAKIKKRKEKKRRVALKMLVASLEKPNRFRWKKKNDEPAEFVGYFLARRVLDGRVRFRTGSDAEISVRTQAVVVQVRDQERLQMLKKNVTLMG